MRLDSEADERLAKAEVANEFRCFEVRTQSLERVPCVGGGTEVELLEFQYEFEFRKDAVTCARMLKTRYDPDRVWCCLVTDEVGERVEIPIDWNES
jgi:hypothetical protein